MQRETRIAHYVVGSLTALSLVLLSLPLSSPVRAFKACASYVFDPISYEGERGSQRLTEAPSRVRELLSADIENRRLQEELRRTAWLKSTVDGLSLENERLRRALGLKTPPGRHPVWAHVMERDPQRWYGSIGVDAGADRGVSLNDPVLGRKDDAVVAVGRVIEVRPLSSTVLLLTDQRSAAAAYLSSGTLEGLVQGLDAPHLRMNYINSEARLVPDDAVYTSPTSATFPPDVMIGRVARVYPRDPFLAFQSVEVAPALDAAALQEVLILRARTLPGEEPLPEAPGLVQRAAPAPPAAAAAPALAARRRSRPAEGVVFSTAAAAAAAAVAAPKGPSAPSSPEEESSEEAPRMSYLRAAVLFVAVMFLQWWWNTHLSYWGAAPQFLLAFTVLIAARRGPVPAMFAGFVWGLFSDTLRADLFGADALLYALAGYAAGMVRRQLDLSAPEPLAATVFLMTWAYALMLGVLGHVFLRSFVWVGWISFLTVPFMNALVAVLGAVFLESLGNA